VILLDADVILDVAIDREPHAEASAALLHHLERRPFGAFVAWHTLSNLYYLLRPARGQDDARAFLRALTEFVHVAPTDTEAFRFALSLPLKDLEDAMPRTCVAKVERAVHRTDVSRMRPKCFAGWHRAREAYERSASNGLAFAALRAGRYVASIPAAAVTPAAAARLHASDAETP
jgi:predicted nucleic acid-binding protein